MKSGFTVLWALLGLLAAIPAHGQMNQPEIITIPASPISAGSYLSVIVPVQGCIVPGTGYSQSANAPGLDGAPTVVVTDATPTSLGLIDITVTELKGIICNKAWYPVPVALRNFLSPGLYRINYSTHQLSLDIAVSNTTGTPVIVPRPGLWAITSEMNGSAGRGFQVELSGDTLVLTFYGYDAQGKASFWLASGPYSYNRFVGDLVSYQGGNAFGMPYNSANYAGSPGQVTVTFTSATTGTITLPNEGTKEISYFGF